MKIALIYRSDYDEFDLGGEVSKLLGWTDLELVDGTVASLTVANPPRLENRAAYMRHNDPNGNHHPGYPRFHFRTADRI